MRKIELDSRAFIASEGKMNFIALGSEKTSDPEFVREFIIPKIHKETTHHDKGFWGTLGLSDDEKIEWKGYLEVSREGNQVDSQEGVVSDEVSDLERCFIDLKEDEESILEHVISFEHVVIDFPESFTPEEMPSARLDVMLPRDHGAIAFYQSHRDSKDEETAIEYILPKATAGNNTNERDRLTYHFDLIPQRRAKEIEGAPGFYRLESEEKRTPFIVKVITFRRSWEDTSKMRFQRETSKEIIERVTKTLGAGDIRNTLAVDHKLLVFSQDRNDFIEAEKGHVRADLKTLFLIHGTFGSTRSSFGKLYGSDSSWLKSLIDRGLYGQILAYDHPTVFFGAEENIALLLRKLGKLIDTPFAHDMDFIGTSQGGLLVQYLANLSDKGILNVGRAALVASANGVQYFTVGKYVSKFLTALKFILKLASRPGGALAASLAQHSADFLLKQPGFRIMTPGDEKLLQIINVPPVYERTLYLPLVDDYDESIIDDRDWRKLKKRIMKFGAGVVDNITGRILGEENDWVVGTRNQYMVPADYCAIPDYNPAKFRDKMIPAIHGSCIYHDDARILIEDFLSGRAVTSGKVRTDLFDAHCHLFGRDIITARIVLLLIEELVNYREIKDRTDDLIELPDITGNGLSPSQVNPGSVAGNVIRYFLLNRDSDHMLRDLEDEYYKLNSEVYKYIALMFDLEMTFRNSYRTANDDQSLEEMQEDFRKRLAGYRKDISELIGEFNQGGKKIFKGSVEDNEKGVEILKTIRSSLKVLKPENLDLVGDEPEPPTRGSSGS